MKSKVLLVLLLLGTYSAQALAKGLRLDPLLQKHLSPSKLNSESEFSILVVYRQKPVLGKSISAQKLSMIGHTAAQEKSFFLGLAIPSQSLRTLWLGNATRVRLNSRMFFSLLKRAKDLGSIESISLLGKKAKLIVDTKINSAMVPFASFTYGLEMIGIPTWRRQNPQGLGQGVRVGIIDTGIDPRHPDLVGKTKFFKDFINPKNTLPMDDHGHGTHVAGTIAGGEASRASIGVAPNVELLVVKAFSEFGSSVDEDLLLALQWLADPDGNPATQDHANVINSSWNLNAIFADKAPEDEPFCVVTENLVRLGIHAVFAAGNDGSADNSILVPGACPFAFTVGATDDIDQAPDFSSRGPTIWKSVTLQKPDVAAPGVYIRSAEPGGNYRYRSGTSMAAPHVTGALALLVQSQPQLSVQDRQAAILNGAKDKGAAGWDNVFGAGRLDMTNLRTF